jgi:hypothetical protein
MKVTDYKFLAGIHGIDLDKSVKKTTSKKKEDSPTKEDAEEESLFKGPEAYAKMTQEEKEAETQRMMDKLKGFFGVNKAPIGL